MDTETARRPARENAETKGRRYLVEGRLLIERLTEETIQATARGNGEFYRLGYDGGGWWCECPALGRCCHLVALQAVTVRPRGAK